MECVVCPSITGSPARLLGDSGKNVTFLRVSAGARLSASKAKRGVNGGGGNGGGGGRRRRLVFYPGEAFAETRSAEAGNRFGSWVAMAGGVTTALGFVLCLSHGSSC